MANNGFAFGMQCLFSELRKKKKTVMQPLKFITYCSLLMHSHTRSG